LALWQPALPRRTGTLVRDFLLSDEDRAFRAELRDFLAGELQPRHSAIEDRADWGTVRDALRAVGQAGYLKLMFPDRYDGR
jgi:alkylation response protein AidB-like acyl-CoA dehydrogenase